MNFKIPKISKTKKAVYVTKDMVINLGREKVDLVLSPVFYWVKKAKFKVKRDREALKYAPSIFDGQLENIEKYRYLALRLNEEEFLFIAYNPKDILDILKNDFGISENNINNIYTAQTEFKNIETQTPVSRTKMLVKFNEIISEVPRHSYDNNYFEFVANHLENNSRTKYKLKYADINQGGTSVFVASILPISMIVYFGADIMKKNVDLEHLNSEIEKRREAYKLPSTSFQIKSIKNRYLEIERKQMKIRNSIYWLQTNKFSKYGKIIHLVSDKKGLSFKLELKKGANLNKIKAILQKRNKDVDFNKDENILEVSFKNE